ncbi:MAG: hypothetical protein IJ071_12950 [Ruminococcus sp.]|nr:hypothetical protein [Ruminococcus sp.]
MRKRLLSALTAAAMTASAGVCFPATAKAADPITSETSDGFTYEIGEDYAAVTGWTGDKETVTSLTLPETVEGQPVTRLGMSAISDMLLLSSLTLPSSLKDMRWWAIEKVPSLKELTIPKGFD